MEYNSGAARQKGHTGQGERKECGASVPSANERFFPS